MKARKFDTILFHAKCADGIGGSWVFWRENKKLYDSGKVKITGCVRDQPPPDVTSQRVVIVDFCYSVSDLLNMAKQCKSLLIIDHHESAKQEVEEAISKFIFPKNISFILDTTKSGAQLAWEYVYPTEPRPWFIDVIASRDLWTWSDPDHKILSTVLYKKGYYDWDKLEDLYHSTLSPQDRLQTIEHLKSLGSREMLELDKSVASSCHNSFLTTYTSPSGSTYRVRLATCDRKIRSEVGNKLSEDCDFAVIWQYDFLLDQFWCAARASDTNDIDLASIMRQHGGGGHRKAASFVIDGAKGEKLQTYFSLAEVPDHRVNDAIKYGILSPEDLEAAS